MSIPAHKSGTAGQIVNVEELDKMSYKSHPKTLGDVIDNVLVSEQRLEKKKMTFGDWLNRRFPEGFENFEGNLSETDLFSCWHIAQENV